MENKNKNEICPLCNQPIETTILIGFGKATTKKCGCKDPFAAPQSKTGFGNPV